MKTKKISAAFLQNLEEFASKNTKFKLLLSDINLNNLTIANINKIFTTLSNAILESQLTVHIADIFKTEILTILSNIVHNTDISWVHENHLRICLALSKLVNVHPDILSLVIEYFERFPAPFVKPQFEGYLSVKKSKMDMNNEILISDLEVVTISYMFLKSSPDYFRHKWQWSEFITKYVMSEDHMIQWICCQCIGVITAMNPYQLYKFINKVLSRSMIIESSISFEANTTPKVTQDINSVDIPTYLSSNKISDKRTSIVSFGGISVPIYKKSTKLQIKLVEVDSTRNNLRKLAMGVMSNKPINLLGPVGSGKSLMVEYMAEKTGRVLGEDFIKIQLGDQTDSKMLLGTYRCTDIPGEFVWQPGVLTQAVVEGNWLLLEDIDSASTDIASLLCGLLENGHLSVPGYRDLVHVKPGFQLFVTQRLLSSITGYHKKRSHGCDILNKHLLSFNIEPLSSNELQQVIITLFPVLETIASRIVSVFEAFTKSCDENGSVYNGGRLVSTRDLFKWCSRAIVDYDVSSTTSALKILQDGIDIFCCSYHDKDARLNLAKVISSHLGIISENATYFCTQYKPNLSLTPDGFKAGRATLKRIDNVREASVKFCFTRPSACLLDSIMCCIVANEPVLLVGETGTGKTSTVQFLARTLGQELIVINMNQQSDSADLLGGFKPVDLKLIVAPLRKEFENIFRSYFNVEQNKKFLGHIAYCFNTCLYNELVLLMKKSYGAAMQRLTKQSETNIGKKRKSEISDELESKPVDCQEQILEKWRDFGKKLERLELQLKHRNALAFTFIEGSLVRAVEKGQWVLLDEINLANAETLECLSSLLEGPRGSLNLLERGDKKPIKRHPNFTLFACMNPSTDVGKKDLPSGLRNRFTEFFVDELTENTDLLMLANSYLESRSLQENKIERLVKFYLKVRKEAQLNLADGSGQKPHFSLRSFCRALYIASKNPCGHINRSLYEAFCLSFLTQLDLNSYNIVEAMITDHIIGSAQEFKSIMKHNIPKPYGSFDNYIQLEGYWIPLGPLECVVPDNYILTKSVKKNLKDLVRIVSIGQLPVLLQGDTSVGKTSLIIYLANASGHKCVRINNHEHTDLQEYIGSYVADVNGKLVFREGLLVEAMRKGNWIILDELNLAPSDVLEALNRVLDDNREIFIPETQEVVKAHPHFMLFATQNPPGSYGGRKVLSRAFRNRFIELHFNEIPSDELEIILHQRCQMAPSYAKKMIHIMKDLQTIRRGSAAFSGKYGFITLRDLFRWGERYRLAENKSTLYDWDQHIADEGYLLLAGKVRKATEKVEIATVIKKHMKREVDPHLLFTLSEKTSPATRSILEKIEQNKTKHSNIVWTFSMRQLAVLLSKALQFHEPALLVGETGGGKTTVCDLLAEYNNQKLITVNCHMHTESGDFIGGLRPVRDHTGEDVNKLFEWVDGPLIEAMVNGTVFLADEISLADDSVLERLNSLLEPERMLLLAEKGIDINNMENSELVVAHRNFYFIGTMNPGGDFGKKELSPALRNRFTEIWCEPCNNKGDLVDIINHNIKSDLKGSDVDIGILIMDFIEWFRNEEIGRRFTISIRDILTWVHFINMSSETMNLGDMYMNGACLTFLDSFGSGVTSSESDYTLMNFKARSLEYIAEQLRKYNLYTSPLFESSRSVEKRDQLFGINPFYIKVGSGVSEDISFTFDVPTIKHNTLKLLRGLQLKKAILLEGSPGVGKTSLVVALAKSTNNKIYRVNLSDQTDISDLFGADLPVEGGESGQFSWRDGPLLQALKKGHWILLDELNLASQSVLEGLNACLDHRGEIFIPELGKTFHVKPGTKFFACQNPLIQGGSRRGLPKSFLNRFTQVYISGLSDKDYLYILKNQFPQIPTNILSKMVEFNDKLTKELANNTFGSKGGPWECNLRDLTRWCEVTIYNYNNLFENKHYSPESTVKLIYGNRLRTFEDRRQLETLFEAIFNRKFAAESTTVYVTKSDVYFGDVCLKREINECDMNVHKQEETCLILRSQLKDLRSLTYCLNMNWMSILVGDSGCGKTSIVRTLAYLAGKPLHTLPMTTAMDTSDLLGGFEQTDYTRHLDDIFRNTEELLLRATQNLLLKGHYNQAVDLLRQWEKCSNFFGKVNKNRTMTAETALFMEKLENLSGIWETFRSNATISEDIKQTAEKVAKKGRILLATVKKEGTLNAGGKFEWVDSILIKCLQNGHWLLIDNANLCSPAVLDRLNALLEPNGTLAISEKGVNENGDMVEIRPHKDFRLFLTMNPKNGEISRAMRNRGVEIFLTNDYKSAEDFDIKSLINVEGIVDNNIIELLINMHSFIADLIVVDKPNIESILQTAFLISQQIKRGVELDEAVTNTIVDIYYKPRSENDFNSNDPLSVIKNEIQRHLNEKILRVIDIYDPRITLKSTELNSNTDFAKIKQQFVAIRKYFQRTPENYTVIYYFIMHLYSISSPEDIDLRYFYLNRIIVNENCPILYKQANEMFYKIFLEIQGKNETVHLPIDKKWLPDTIYKNINTSLGNRLLLAIYYSIHSYLNDCRISTGSDKEKYSLMKYSADVKAGKIQDRINDVVIRQGSTLIEKCDKFFNVVFKNENIALTDEQVIEVMSLFQWRVNFVNQLLTTYCGSKEKVLELKEILPNLHVYYKWFVKNCIHKVLALVKIQQKPDILKMVSLINSELVNCFDNLKKLGRQFQKMSLKPPPLTNAAQLTVIPEYHKMIEVFSLAKDANISKVLLKMSDKDFAAFLINLKVNLNYDMEEIPANYRQFKEIVEKFHREVDKIEYQKSDMNYLLITNYLSIITIYQERLNNMENILNVASIPCVLQGVIKQYQTTKDRRLAHEITSQTTQYLLNNPSTMPWKYIKYKSNREDIKELILSWQSPTLTYLLSSILVNPNSKTFGMRVDLKDYHQAINLYNKLNHLLWKNCHQLADMNCDFIYLETKYIIKKVDTFIQSLGTLLGIDTCNRSIPELIKLCIEEIKLVQTSLEDELTVWCYFLSQCHEQLLQLNCTSLTTNTNAIANCYITISYLNALLNSKLPPIDPYKKILLKKNHIANEIANFENLDTSFKIQSEIYSNVEYPLCPIIKQRIQFLREQMIKLSKETAMRPHLPEYQSLLMDINHAFQTVLSPKKINILFKNLDQILSESDTNSTNYDAIKQATLTVTSIENFIHVLNQYRYFYPDIIEPLYCNTMELTYGIKMKITYVERLICQKKFVMHYGIDIQNKLTNFVKFPTLNENQRSIQETIDNYMDKPMQDLIANCSFAEQDPSREHEIKFSLLKCAIQDTFNSCTINAKYSQAPNIILFDKFNKFIKQFVTTWDKQEKERQAKETEKESLYKVKTKCDDKPEDEQIEEEFINLFPSYITEFSDMQTPELKDDLPIAPQNQAESLITLDDINLVYNLHAAFLYSHSKSPWLNLNEKHNYVDHVTQLSQKFKLLKLMLDSNICTALNYKMDSNILGSLHLLINIAQKYGSTKLSEDIGSPTCIVTKKSLNFYRDSNIDEIKPCYQILQELRHKIQELLSEWPEHPTLQNIFVLIERICNFDIASPISKFLTGFDILLNKCHEWEENAHSGVSIQTHILNITAQIITWRKLELNMWRDILNITFNRLNEPIGKWWCYMYEIIEQFEEDTITTSDLITTLIKFITESNLAEFENRLELLFLFHCHCLHVRCSKKSNTLINILWNIYHHYKHFLSVILLKIKEFRTPIEKKLKEYVKIVTWKDVNYWSIKETLHKTHKTIHKHIREFEKVLRQSVYPFLCDNSEQDTVYENVGIWDRPQRVSPKTYHYTMDCLSYIARKGSPKKLTDAGDKVSAIKTEKHFKKSLTLCKQVISAAQYPKLVKSLDTVIGEIIETSNYLQKLEVDTTLPKDKQKMQAKNILRQKQRSVADLFKLLIKMGVSFKKGILESKLNKPETRFTTKPIDLEALFDHLNKQRNDEKILTMWDGCELYYLRSTIRLNLLEESLQRPSKDLGPQNIERCKGFSNDLVVLLHEQKQKLITSSETFYYLRYYLNYFIDFCNETQFIHKDIFEDLRSSMCNLTTIIEHFKIILQTCPEEAHDETILNTVPVLKPEKMNALCCKYDENWNKANGLLNNTMTSIEKVLILLKKNKNIIPSSKSSFIAPLYIPMSDFDGILEELEYLKLKISNLLDLFGDIPLYNSLRWALNTIDDIKNKLIVSKPTALNVDKYIENVAKNSEILLKKFLIAFQNLYKKYKTPTEIELTEKSVSSEEIDSTIYDEHLTNIITTSLFNDLSSLNTIEILECLEKIVENINKINPTHYSKITNTINQNLQLLERFVLFFEYFITQQVSSYRVTSKLTSILLNIFIELAKKGFCIPPEFSDELSGEGEKQQSGGMGLGDGEGEKDVSDRIESEDQLDDAKQGQTQQENENKDCKEEDNAIEMSDDFDSKLQDGDKDRENEDEESQSDAEEQMGDTEKGADQIDEQIWGSDEEEEDTDDKDVEEKGNRGEKDSEQKIGAKENQSGENEESPDVQDEPKDKQSTNPINEQDPEYDDDQIDPYHGNQPELPEPEPMDLPDNLELDEENEKADEENQEENPFDVDTMKEQIPPKDKEENADEEQDENRIDEENDENSDDDKLDEKKNEIEEVNEDNAPENIENIEPENEPTLDNLENIDKSETSTLDQKDTNENQVQPMDIDNNINESADKVNANQTKNQTSSENDPINQEDMPDKEGVGQSQMEESSTGHKGAANAQQETSDSQQETHERSRKPGASDSKRSLGDASESVQKRLKTVHTDDSQPVKENETKESNAEMYQHIKEAQDHTEQVLDVATKEQVEQQKEIPIITEEETEKPTESSEDLPEQHEEDLDMKNEIKQKAERLQSDKKDMTDKVEHPEGDIVKNADMEVEVEGEIIQTSVVPRGDQSSHHTQLFNIIESTKLTAEDMITIRAQIEEQLANWSETPSSEEAQRTWEKISSLTSSLAQHLSEQLRLVLEPTQASRLRGDFKTGKRINMRKIIPYIASQFRKDKIWLKRTKPAKRQYQIVLAIDDSSSMDDNHSKELAFESVALISKALTLLESGQLSVLSFGETTELLHKLEEPFTDKNGHKLLQKFNFEQKKTCVGQMVNFATEMLNTAHFQTNALNAKLLVIVSDGRGIFSEGETYIKQAIRRATLANIFMVFIIIDNPVNNSSILDIKMPVFNKTAGDLITINNYMDSFPFPFYIILRDINSLPNVLSDALRQWFEMVSNKDR